MKCPYQKNIECRYINTVEVVKTVACGECELYDPSYKQKNYTFLKIIVILIIIIILSLIL